MVIFFSVQKLEWPGEGPLFELDSNKRWGQNAATIGAWALRQILHYQGDHKWKYLPSDQDWNGLGRGHYSTRTQINVGEGKNAATIRVIPRPLLKSGLGPWPVLQEIISGTPEQKYFPSDQDWIGLGRGHYSS